MRIAFLRITAKMCVESTGKYWIPIYNILERTCDIVLAHPKYVKAIRGKKTDVRQYAFRHLAAGFVTSTMYNVAAGLFYRTTKQPGGDALSRIALRKDCSIIKAW